MIARLFRRSPPEPVPPAEAAGPSRTDLRRELLRHPQLWWLTDVPLFIDERSVDRLHGAIVQP